MLFAPFLAGAALALFAADRVVGVALSLELELWDPERVFSPLADDEGSALLFDLRERLSAGIFPAGSSVHTTGSNSTSEEGEDRGPRRNEKLPGTSQEASDPKGG